MTLVAEEKDGGKREVNENKNSGHKMCILNYLCITGSKYKKFM